MTNSPITRKANGLNNKKMRSNRLNAIVLFDTENYPDLKYLARVISSTLKIKSKSGPRLRPAEVTL